MDTNSWAYSISILTTRAVALAIGYINPVQADVIECLKEVKLTSFLIIFTLQKKSADHWGLQIKRNVSDPYKYLPSKSFFAQRIKLYTYFKFL